MSGSCHLDKASNVKIGVECQIFVMMFSLVSRKFLSMPNITLYSVAKIPSSSTLMSFAHKSDQNTADKYARLFQAIRIFIKQL